MIAALVLALVLAPAERPGYFGFALTLHSDATSQWMIVQDVTPGGAAARAGLAPMDVITAIDGKPLHFRDDADFLDFIGRTRPGDRLRFTVMRKQRKKTIVVKADTMPDAVYEAWQVMLEIAKRHRPTP
jgi:S1-C subfamily serine protease